MFYTVEDLREIQAKYPVNDTGAVAFEKITTVEGVSAERLFVSGQIWSLVFFTGGTTNTHHIDPVNTALRVNGRITYTNTIDIIFVMDMHFQDGSYKTIFHSIGFETISIEEMLTDEYQLKKGKPVVWKAEYLEDILYHITALQKKASDIFTTDLVTDDW